VNTLLHAVLCVFLRNLLNVLVQITNKMGLKKKEQTLAKSLKIILNANRMTDEEPTFW
jgi:hypothetical protein